MFLIVVPIVVVMEVIEGTRPFRAFVRGWARLVGRWLGMSEQAAAPTVVGFLFGLAYGGSLIVRDTRRHGLRRRQVFQMSVFLSMVHAIVEDSPDLHRRGRGERLLGRRYRSLWAIAVTAVAGRRWRRSPGAARRARGVVTGPRLASWSVLVQSIS